LRLLLDTHVLLWGMTADRRLPPAIRQMIRADDNDSFVSVASIWEIAIKVRLGKLVAPDDLLVKLEDDSDFTIMNATADHP